MSSAERIELKTAGQSITMLVTACGIVPVGNYPEVQFVGQDGTRTVDVRVPQKSADRQLARIPLTYAECVGRSVTISRDPNASDAKKPYWGITAGALAPGAKRPVSAGAHVPGLDEEPPHPATADTTSPTNGHDEKKSALYAKITDYVLERIVPKYEAKEIPVTMEGTAAICATLYISATRNA